MKVLKCRDIGTDCDFEVHAETKEEVLRQAADHGRTVHDLNEITEELKAKLLVAIRDA